MSGKEIEFPNSAMTLQRTMADHENMIAPSISRVLVIYTGGTIGMKYSLEFGYVPVAGYFTNAMLSTPQFHDPNFEVQELTACITNTTEESNEKGSTIGIGNVAQTTNTILQGLVTPESVYGKRILYGILEYSPLLDSCNMTMKEWLKIAKDIELNYNQYDAFIVLHGTDTMSYTASALSFLLENLGKTVIITGSQVPLAEMRNDAVNNLLGSLTIAGHYIIPEVSLYFNNKLFRGNRCTKNDAFSFSAFDSPNMSPLVEMGVNIQVRWRHVLRPKEVKRLKAHQELNPNVGSLRLFPSITESTVRAFLAPPMQGVVLLTFGTGNAPTRSDLMQAFKKASERGVVIVNITQCTKGTVSDVYATGKALSDAGVVPGNDMTAECALTKLSYLLGKNLRPIEIRKLMQESLRGELTVAPAATKFSLQNEHLLQKLFQFVKANDVHEQNFLEKSLVPTLLLAAVQYGNIDFVDYILKETSTVTANSHNFDGRTPLHVASASGQYKVAEWLVKYGANVHSRDSFLKTPLVDALINRHDDICFLLKATGAFLRFDSKQVLHIFFESVYSNDLERLKLMLDLGANCNETNADKRSALHVASSLGHFEIANFLIQRGIDISLLDRWGKTAYDEAKYFGHDNIMEIIRQRKM